MLKNDTKWYEGKYEGWDEVRAKWARLSTLDYGSTAYYTLLADVTRQGLALRHSQSTPPAAPTLRLEWTEEDTFIGGPTYWRATSGLCDLWVVIDEDRCYIAYARYHLDSGTPVEVVANEPDRWQDAAFVAEAWLYERVASVAKMLRPEEG